MDAKDILGLPKTAFPGNQERKSRTPKEPQRKSDGVSREVNLKPKVLTKAVCAEHLELRKEILTLLNLQKQMQKVTEATGTGSGSRERPNSEAPSTPKRSNRDMDRAFVPDAVGKRDQKRKAPGRFEPPPSPPQSKRPRKYKASD